MNLPDTIRIYTDPVISESGSFQLGQNDKPCHRWTAQNQGETVCYVDGYMLKPDGHAFSLDQAASYKWSIDIKFIDVAGKANKLFIYQQFLCE